jgi:hypothetical protein
LFEAANDVVPAGELPDQDICRPTSSADWTFTTDSVAPPDVAMFAAVVSLPT